MQDCPCRESHRKGGRAWASWPGDTEDHGLELEDDNHSFFLVAGKDLNIGKACDKMEENPELQGPQLP